MNVQYTIGAGIGFNKHGEAISPARAEAALDHCKREAARLFGGYTMRFGPGGWVNSAGALVAEQGVSIMLLGMAEDRDKARGFAGIVRDVLVQESVVFIEQSVIAEFL